MSTVIEGLYAFSSVIFIAAGLGMAGMGLRAYVQTERVSMLLLAIGFAITVAGSAATLISAFLYGFQNAAQLLLVQSGLFTVGLLFVMYSIVAYGE